MCRYEPGQRFNQHYDDSVDMGNGLKTAYTLLMYLSGQEYGMQGGETVFYSHGKHSLGASLPYALQPELLAFCLGGYHDTDPLRVGLLISP